MAKTEEHGTKSNSSDTLLAIYILQILKRHSSPQTRLTAKDVYGYLQKEYSIGRGENEDAQVKKTRRYLNTLHESYLKGCIRKAEGRSKSEGHLWWYDANRDDRVGEDVQVQETLSDVEIGFLVDLLTATKILNSEGTRGIIDKLLKKISISDEDRMRRLDAIQEEGWFKTPNEDLIEKKECLQEYIDDCDDIVFDYDNEESIIATPLDWSFDGGICFLNAIVEGNHRKFELDKIRNYAPERASFEDPEDYRRSDEETDSDKTTLDSLFVNIPTINNAIANRKCIKFLYRSYKVSNGRVVYSDNEKSVLPHSCVFNDGKYYLIGFNEDSQEPNKIAYFRVDLMFELHCSDAKIKMSDWDNYLYEAIERARVVDNHPLMVTGRDITVTFKVVESALDRVIDAFNVKPDQMSVTKETRAVKDLSDEGFHDERIVRVDVRTSEEEAFRWALANADAVEITTQAIRNKIARLSDPIYQLYTQTMPDKLRANFDYVLREGTFKISSMVDEDTAYETYEELANRGKLGAVDNIGIAGDDICDLEDYLGNFINAKRLYVFAPQLKNLSWASRLVNIENLELTQMQIDDSLWMKTLKKLRRVYLIESSITDLSVLSEHEDIWYLDISDTNVSDISFIDKYQKLDYLNIVNCPIEDYSPLFTMQSRLHCLEIDERALEAIGEERIRERHIGIDIIPRKNSPFWRALI